MKTSPTRSINSQRREAYKRIYTITTNSQKLGRGFFAPSANHQVRLVTSTSCAETISRYVPFSSQRQDYAVRLVGFGGDVIDCDLSHDASIYRPAQGMDFSSFEAFPKLDNDGSPKSRMCDWRDGIKAKQLVVNPARIWGWQELFFPLVSPGRPHSEFAFKPDKRGGRQFNMPLTPDVERDGTPVFNQKGQVVGLVSNIVRRYIEEVTPFFAFSSLPRRARMLGIK